MFSLRVKGSTQTMIDALDLENRLDARIKISPREYDGIMSVRETCHNMRDYEAVGTVVDDAGTWYLEAVDGLYRRSYRVVGE